MNKTVAFIYLMWSLALIGAGIYIVKKITDTSDPASLSSSMKQLKEAMDEDSQVP